MSLYDFALVAACGVVAWKVVWWVVRPSWGIVRPTWVSVDEAVELLSFSSGAAKFIPKWAVDVGISPYSLASGAPVRDWSPALKEWNVVFPVIAEACFRFTRAVNQRIDVVEATRDVIRAYTKSGKIRFANEADCVAFQLAAVVALTPVENELPAFSSALIAFVLVFDMPFLDTPGLPSYVEERCNYFFEIRQGIYAQLENGTTSTIAAAPTESPQAQTS